jgi:hypothetical protein
MMMAKVAPHPGLRAVAWLAVFALELITPLRWGWECTQDGGRVGMIVAVALIYLAGHWACVCSGRTTFVLVTGGACVGLSQVFPLLHITAGMKSLELISAAGMTNRGDVYFSTGLTELGGFLATCLTGAQLLAVAVVCGVFAWRVRMASISGQPQGEP